MSLAAAEGEAEVSLREGLALEEVRPDERARLQQRGAAASQAVAALSGEVRVPLILSVYEELPQAEIAAIPSRSVEAGETRIYRARQELRARRAGRGRVAREMWGLRGGALLDVPAPGCGAGGRLRTGGARRKRQRTAALQNLRRQDALATKLASWECG